MPTIFRLTMLGLAGPTAVTLVLVCAAGLVLQATGLLLTTAVVPDLSTTLRICGGLLPAVLEYALPVAFLVGATVAYGRWKSEGTWVALRAAGVGGRRLLLPVLALGLIGALLLAGLAHHVAPAGRRGVSRELSEAHGHVKLLPGHFMQLRGVVLHRGLQGSLMVAEGDTVLVARQGSLEPREGGLLVRLNDGRAMGAGPDSATLAFDEALLPLPLSASGRRVELAERADAELSSLIGRMRDRGKQANYEQVLLLKRTTLPLAMLLLPWVCLPLGLRWGGKPSHTVAVAVGFWALVRIGDGACATIGAGPAAALPLLGLAIASLALWAGWADR